MKSLVGKKLTKKVKFMNEDIEISKLSVAEVLEIQSKAKLIEGNEAEGFNVMKTVIRSGAAEAKDLSDEDFDNFPLDELNKLAEAIMQHSGIKGETGK